MVFSSYRFLIAHGNWRFLKWKPYFSAFQIFLFFFPLIFSIFNKGFTRFGVVHVATRINELRFMHLKPQTLSQNMFSNIVFLQWHSTFNTFDPLGLFILLKFDSAKLNPLISFCKTTHFMSGYKPIHLLSRIINSHPNMPVSTSAAEWRKKFWWLYRNALNFYGMLGEYHNSRQWINYYVYRRAFSLA